jgi:hypothetical protein
VRSRFAGLAFSLGTVFTTVCAPSARADEPPPSAERLRSAAEEYDKGRRFYQANDFEQAAVHFENAYNDAPRAEPLRNAIRSRRQAKQLSRAATLAALAASKYADDPTTMSLVNEVLGEATPKLHRTSVQCKPACALAADGRVVGFSEATDTRVFLDPGPHTIVVSWPGDRTKQIKVDATAGGKSDYSVEAPPPKPQVGSGGGGGTVVDTGPPPQTKPLPPLVFFIGAGLTVGAGAATIISGIDAKNNPGVDAVRRDCVGLGESCPTYQQGKNAETRTNVLLGVTAGLAVATAVVGIFFTQWQEPVKKGSLAPFVGSGDGGGSAGVSGRF